MMLALLLELHSWTFWLVTAAEVLKGAAVVTLSVMAGNGRVLVTPPRADVNSVLVGAWSWLFCCTIIES